MGTPIPNLQREASVSFDGEIKTYKLTPEELEEVKRKYGSPVKNQRQFKEKYSAARIMEALNKSDTIEEAAEKMCINLHRLKVEMALNKITVTEKQEDAGMKTTPGIDVVNIPQNMPIPNSEGFQVYENKEKPGTAPQTPKKSRLELALELITREQFIAWKQEGLNDKAVAKRAGFVFNSDTMMKLREKWNLKGVVFTTKNYTPPVVPPAPSIESEQAEPEAVQAQPINIEEELAALRNKISWLIEWSTIMHDRMRSVELALEGAACPLPQTMEEPQVRTIIDAYGQMMQIAYKLGAGEELTGEENDFYRDFCMMTRAATANDFYHLEHRINHHWHGSLSVHDSKAYFYERKNNLAR